MKRQKLNLTTLKVNSFITEGDQLQLMGGTACPPQETDPGANNCPTYNPCHSTGTGEGQTGWGVSQVTNPTICNN